jgi:PTS system cellobiose-specific IIB component
MNILLVCSAGMSTSLLVTKMEESAESQGLDAKIWAVPANEADANFDQCDIVLLGPQVRYMLKKFEGATDKPVRVIDMIQYGTMNGEAVLNTVKETLGL